MISLLASITGFISSLLPEILKIFKDINDKKHELNILDRQLESSKLNHTKTFAELNISREIAEQNSLYATYHSNSTWVDALNSSVRHKSIIPPAILVEYLDVLWNIEDQAIFAGIISFYFGQRTFSKLWKNK